MQANQIESKRITLQKTTIFEGKPSERTLCLVGDISGNGHPEIIYSERIPEQGLYALTLSTEGDWQRHTLSRDCGALEAGGCLADLTGNGRLDLVAGNDASGNGLYWWENPGELGKDWPQHRICTMPANGTHDQLIADVDADGRPEVYFWNQASGTLFVARVPDDPTQTPWPTVRPIVTGVSEEGLIAADMDGDGRLEIVAGQSWYKPPETYDGKWERHVFAEGFHFTRLAAGDFLGNGETHIVVAEGDASFTRQYYGRLAYLRPNGDSKGLWHKTILHDKLLDPHSLIVADFDGDGMPDIFVGELGDPRGDERQIPFKKLMRKPKAMLRRYLRVRPIPHAPKQRFFWNRSGTFVEQVIDTGVGTHESKLYAHDDSLAIVGKPYLNLNDTIKRQPDVDAIHLWHLQPHAG